MNTLSRKFEWEADAFAYELQSHLNTAEYADLGDRHLLRCMLRI